MNRALEILCDTIQVMILVALCVVLAVAAVIIVGILAIGAVFAVVVCSLVGLLMLFDELAEGFAEKAGA